MIFFERHKRKIIVLSIILVSLVFTFLYGGNASDTPFRENHIQTETNRKVPSKRNKKEKETSKEEAEENGLSEDDTEEETQQSDTQSMTAEEKTEPAERTAEEEKREPFSPAISEYQPQKSSENEAAEENKELLCTLSVKCSSILNNLELFDKEKLDILPKDGIIYNERSVEFSEGETVYDVLAREMKNSKIHFEYTKAPIYGQVYIEGINNIYEFDCGELSGWLYRVNGYCPDYACSEYKLSSGDKIEILYTCDLGADAGGYNSRRKTE